MVKYSINKGIGRSAEFKGLKSQYLLVFAGGLLFIFLVVVIMYMGGINQWVCIASGLISALVLVYGTFYLNARFGEHGLMKWQAGRSRPRFIINRRRIGRLFTRNLKNRKA
jgi:hypothetical protein